MKPAAFRYFCPGSLSEAVGLLGEYGEDGKVLAGGQSLVPAMNFRLARPAVLVDINEISALDYIRSDGDRLAIGALTRHAAFHRSVADGPLGQLLSNVVRYIAHYPIRQRGTFAGSLAHADPAAEWCLAATTLGADIVICGKGGERVAPAASFFKGTFTTDLRHDELIREVRLPLLQAGWRTGFYEFSRRAGDFALAMALAALRVEGGLVREARLGVGGVADRPIRLRHLEADLVGQTPGPELFRAVGEAAKAGVNPTEDIHASASYRSDLIGTVVRRALAEAHP